MKSSFKRNLLIGFGLSMLLLILSSIASYTSIRNLLSSAQWVEHTNNVIRELDGILSGLKDAETGQRGYLLTGDEIFLEPYHGAADTAMLHLARTQELTGDNPQQQADLKTLENVILQRIGTLNDLAEIRRRNGTYSTDSLRVGNSHMTRAREIINIIKERESRLLDIRTDKLNKLSGFTPILLIITTLLSFLIAIVSFLRLVRDYEERSRLQAALEEKDRATSRRIDIIRTIAEKIADGEYSARVDDEEHDGQLGGLAEHLNEMAISLEDAFRKVTRNEWLQTGLAGLNEQMVGGHDLEVLSNDIVAYVAGYTDSQVGALYLREDDQLFKRYGSFALSQPENRQYLHLGEGLAGQAAKSGRMLELKEVDPALIAVSYAAGDIRPVHMVAFPIRHEKTIYGVLELASVRTYTEPELVYLRECVHNIGAAISSAISRRRLQELLEETQSQSEELQAQHSELENLNAELETQTQKLRISEEELKVQQEELMQSNAELEERSKLLEERNQIIVERNLEIQQKAETLELTTRYKSEFMANMSHELRTPLNSILLLSRLLSENHEGNLDEEQTSSAQVIYNSGKGLLSLVDEILDLSRIEAGKMELEVQLMPVSEMLTALEALFEPVAREKGLSFTVHTSPLVPPAITTDRLRLEQVLKNLLSNAFKFTTGGMVSLEVKPAAGDEGIAFSVTDSGIGIPADKQQVIFEAFQQADGSTRRQYGGTGLGLSISRELVKLLGGYISLESAPGNGSRFTVTIPPAPPAVPSEPAAGTVVPVQHLPASHPEKRLVTDTIPEGIEDDRHLIQEGDRIILIVEDDTRFAKALLDYTRARGYRGVVSVRGDEVLSLAASYHPAGILLDIVLPVKDGWQVMDELKRDHRTRAIPVHIMSSMEVKKESLMKGAIDFISKPVSADHMHLIFDKLEFILDKPAKKVLIVEENTRHAKALAYFLGTFQVNAETAGSVQEGVDLLRGDVDCVVLDMGVPDQEAYATLESVKEMEGLENLPIIIFTGKNLSRSEEQRIRQYADSIVVKTAHSYQRILDEVSIFLHLVEENGKRLPASNGKMAVLNEVLKNKTVLLADDDVRNIYSLTKALEKHQMKVLPATDGREALEQLQDNPAPDIVLMDMMMPQMDGYETIAAIRSNPAYSQLPIIAVTARAMKGDRDKCIQAGASDYISKPVDIDQLLSLLRVWLYDKALR